MNIYLQAGLISLIGLLFSLVMVMRSLLNKARAANLKFNWTVFLSQDLVFQAIGTVLTVSLALMLLGPTFKQYPKLQDNDLLILSVFATIGYIGSDIASRFFSVMNKRLTNAIDYKTTMADTASGTLDAPTPAAKVETPVKP